jgi:hypothetical protein
MASRMSDRVTCDLCDRPLAKHESFVVRTDVYADPSMPPISTEDLAAADLGATLDELMAEMTDMTADDLQDGVHRRFEFRLCPGCHRLFLANPLGKPRVTQTGRN